MRRRIQKLTIITLILILTLSFGTVLLARSPDTDPVLENLQELEEKVSALPNEAFKDAESADNQRKTLENKIQAVIHQIEAGASDEAVNKLQNDLKNAVTAWIKPEYAGDLIKLIDEIITTIKNGDFILSASPDSLTIEQGSSAQSTITVQSLNGFNKLVQLSITSLPISGVTTTLNPLQVVPPSNQYAISILTIDVAIVTATGSCNITVTGTFSNLIRSTNISLTITAPPIPPVPNFSITASPLSLTVQQGGWNLSTLVVASLNGFNGPVDLGVTSQSIQGVTPTLSQSQVTLSPNGFATSTLTVKVSVTATPGEYMLTVTGTSVALENSINIPLKIVAETIPPTINSVLRLPENPNYNDTVTVLASVTDAGSGVKGVVLSYSAGDAWTNVTMTLKDGFYQASIPAFPFDTSVEYRVYASDNSGNWATSKVYSYITLDPYTPIINIDNPSQGSYLRGKVKVTVFTQDDNFERARLLINDTVVALWASPGEHMFDWNTTNYKDGPYNVKLRVLDKAGNIAEKSLTVTVDNTPPSAVIEEPAAGSYLRLSVLIRVTGDDTNFDMMEVQIDSQRVKTWTSGGSEILEWKTRDYSEGVHSVTLTVLDKAGNSREVLATVTVDNTSPIIDTPTWSPEEPAANEEITINVTVTEPSYGSGIQNITLVFKNKTLDEWQTIPMTFTGGNWTAKLSNQSDTMIDFKIIALDKAGNLAQTERFQFQVAAPAGFPLALILLIILLLAILIGSVAYLLWRTRQRKKSAEAAPPAPPPKPTPPVPPPVTPAKKPVREAAPIKPVKGYGMVSFVVPAHNEESTISHRISRVYERASGHAGPSEIIVVDDGSDDNTYEAAWLAVESNRKKWPNIPAKVVKLSSNMGREEAVRFARSKATGEVIETVNGENAATMPAFIGHFFLSL